MIGKAKLVVIIVAAACSAVALLSLGAMFITAEKSYCFGDVCPDNGGVDTFYIFRPRFLCEPLGGEEVWGYGWEEVYAGCKAK
jgi:hypothetical protein